MGIEWVVWFAIYLAVIIVEINHIVPIIIALIFSITSRVVYYYCGMPLMVQEGIQLITFIVIAYLGIGIYNRFYKSNGVEVLESLVGKRCTIVKITGSYKKNKQFTECIVSIGFDEFKGLMSFENVSDNSYANVIGIYKGHLVVKCKEE